MRGSARRCAALAMLRRIGSAKCADTVGDIGFCIGRASPCHFYHSGQNVCGLVHGDDFVLAGVKKHLESIEQHMRTKFKVKVAVTGLVDDEVLRVLSRSIK